jgi:hypothetical protein
VWGKTVHVLFGIALIAMSCQRLFASVQISRYSRSTGMKRTVDQRGRHLDHSVAALSAWSPRDAAASSSALVLVAAPTACSSEHSLLSVRNS